jgi:hypothetical protein
MTQELITTLLPLAIVVLLRLWNTGTIQASVGKLIPQLPKWAQWIPPMALSVGSHVVVWLVQGVGTQELGDVVAQGGTTGLVSVGLWHVAKRVVPAVAVDAIRTAVARGGLPLLFLLVLLGANQACSGSPPQLPPMVCPVPSQYLAALPTPAAVASSVQAAHGVVEHAKVVAEDPTVGAAVLVASRTLDSIEPLCPSLTEIAKVDCAARVAEARAVLAKEESTRQQICSAVKLAVFVAQVAEDTVPLVALDEVCR